MSKMVVGAQPPLGAPRIKIGMRKTLLKKSRNYWFVLFQWATPCPGSFEHSLSILKRFAQSKIAKRKKYRHLKSTNTFLVLFYTLVWKPYGGRVESLATTYALLA